MDKKIVSLRPVKEQPKSKKRYVGVGVSIWMGQPFVMVISGNKSGLAPMQEVFRHLFGGA